MKRLILVPTPWCDCNSCPIEQTCPNASEASDGDFTTKGDSKQ